MGGVFNPDELQRCLNQDFQDYRITRIFPIKCLCLEKSIFQWKSMA